VPANTLVSTFDPVVVPDARSPVAPAKTVPDIGKFRLPIEYTLHNIPAESLIDFLAEEFPQVEAEEAEKTGNISITASLTDHRTIKNMLVEIEREIEALRSEAANSMEAKRATIYHGGVQIHLGE